MQKPNQWWLDLMLLVLTAYGSPGLAKAISPLDRGPPPGNLPVNLKELLTLAAFNDSPKPMEFQLQKSAFGKSRSVKISKEVVGLKYRVFFISFAFCLSLRGSWISSASLSVLQLKLKSISVRVSLAFPEGINLRRQLV
jgi:hypothetical protein